MTLPAPVPLESPPGDPESLAALVSAVAGAVTGACVLADSLAGPAAQAPGWLGADATAAAGQVTAVTGLAGAARDALTAALGRLGSHGVVLADARRAIALLRRDQDDDFAAARAQLELLYADTGGRGDPLGILGDLQIGEATRRRRHDAVLDVVVADAAETTRALADATVGLGGTGVPGDGLRVMAHLAAVLPGWGDGELAALGRRTALDLAGRSAEEVAAALRARDPLLDAAPFAAGLLATLGAGGFVVLVRAAGVARRPDELAGRLARLVAAAEAAPGGPVDAVLDAPVAGGTDAMTAVGLGRMAAAGGLSTGYLVRIVRCLVTYERDPWPVRRDELLVAPGEDPLDATLAALAATGDAAAATGVLGDPALWPGLLGREWTEGLDGLTAFLRLAATGPDGAAAALGAALRAIGGSVDVLVTAVTTGSPEAFTVAALSPVLAELVADHLPVVTDVVAAGLGLPGAPSRPLLADELLLLEGLGMVALEPGARLTVLAALTATTAAAPLTGPGDEIPAAYAEGGVFAAIAFGEAQDIRSNMYSAVARAERNDLAWSVLTLPLGFLPARGAWQILRDTVSAGSSFVTVPGTDVPWEEFLAQPETGADQAAFAVVAARVRPLVAAGLLPEPGGALDGGLGTSAARNYEAGLGDGPLRPGGPVVSDGQRILLHRLRDDARGGYQDVGTALGLLPGS